MNISSSKVKSPKTVKFEDNPLMTSRIKTEESVKENKDEVVNPPVENKSKEVSDELTSLKKRIDILKDELNYYKNLSFNYQRKSGFGTSYPSSYRNTLLNSSTLSYSKDSNLYV